MLDRIHLVVATPCFGGQVSSIYAGSLFAPQSAVRGKSVFHGDIASQFRQAPAADAA